MLISLWRAKVCNSFFFFRLFILFCVYVWHLWICCCWAHNKYN